MGLPFRPAADTITMAVTATSSETTALRDQGNQVRLYNAGPNVAFIRFGVTALTATTADMPIPAGAVEVLTKGGASRAAAICAGTGTATLYLTVGEGS